jgi:hypothetical protein
MKQFIKNQSIEASKSNAVVKLPIDENNPAVVNSINLQNQLKELKKRTLTFESK